MSQSFVFSGSVAQLQLPNAAYSALVAGDKINFEDGLLPAFKTAQTVTIYPGPWLAIKANLVPIAFCGLAIVNTATNAIVPQNADGTFTVPPSTAVTYAVRPVAFAVIAAETGVAAGVLAAVVRLTASPGF